MKFFISVLLLITSQAWAIKYHQSTDGSIKEIDAATFENCKHIFYRNVAKSELPVAHQKNLVRASLKGELMNDLGAVAAKIKSASGSCTYTDNSESLQ